MDALHQEIDMGGLLFEEGLILRTLRQIKEVIVELLQYDLF